MRSEIMEEYNPILDVKPIPLAPLPSGEEAIVRYTPRGLNAERALEVRENDPPTSVFKHNDICTGWSSQEDRPCKDIAIPPSDRCRLHGGKAVKGIDSGQKKNLSRSKYLPKDLKAKVEEADADPNLMSFRQDAAYFEGKLRECLEDQDLTFSYALTVEAALKIFKKLQKEMLSGKKGDIVKIHQYLDELERLLTDGVNEKIKDKERERLLEKLGRTKERETKYQMAAGQFLPLKQVYGILFSVKMIINEEIADEDIRRKVAERLAQLSDVESG